MGRIVRLGYVTVFMLACSGPVAHVPDTRLGVESGPSKLFEGTASAREADRRLAEFREAWQADQDDGGEGYRVFKEFLPELGVTRIAGVLEGKDRSCHGWAHDFGIAIREEAGNLETAMALCGDTCTYGCVHGVFKAHFSEGLQNMNVVPTPDVIRRVVGDACREDSTVVPDFFRGNCAHGIGHAFGGIASQDAKQASEFCSVFSESEMRYYCETGVFMELAHTVQARLDRQRAEGRDTVEDAVASCAEASRFPGACLRFVLRDPSELPEVERLAAACALQSGAVRKGCFNALGFLSRVYVGRRPDHIDAVCAVGNDADRRLCVSGVAFMKKDHRKRERIAEACDHLQNPDLRALCRDQESRYYYRIGNPALAAMLAD